MADAVVIGAGSMIGAGVFAAWSPAADAAGTGLIIGLVIAGLVAFCNASSAQLAAIHSESGGTYAFSTQAEPRPRLRGRRAPRSTWSIALLAVMQQLGERG